VKFRLWVRRLREILEKPLLARSSAIVEPLNPGQQYQLLDHIMAVEYSLYLVTDSTPAILKDNDLVSVVESAIMGGVTIVQFRDKTSETADLIRMGKRLHAITKKHNVPLLINDRIDVALAIGAEGVHLGQEDTGMTA
jgi:thiamine monophosphate synthase